MLPSELENFFNKSGLKVARYSRGEFSIYCPFHDDSTASLFVNPVKGLFNCFAGCVKGSNGIASLLKKADLESNNQKLNLLRTQKLCPTKVLYETHTCL